jgi:hypothetical protein
VRDLFDRRLTNPTAAEVAEAIITAQETANSGHTSGNLLPTSMHARVLAERVQREPEGTEVYFGFVRRPEDSARLSLGWWTNSAGQKLVRVRSWREWSRQLDEWGGQTEEFDRSEDDRRRRPGIWHVDHERIIEASSGGEPEWVAVCGCGAAGSAASLNWQHGMCGPCADRIAEFGPDAVKHAPGLLADKDFEPTDVVFTVDGEFVVGLSQHSYRWWHAADGLLSVKDDDLNSDRVRGAAAPSGHTVLLGTCSNNPIGDGPFETIKIVTRAGLPLVYNIRLRGLPTAALWTGRPGQLLIQTLNDARLNLLDFRTQDNEHHPDVAPPDPGAWIYAVFPAPDAPRAVFITAGHRASLANVEQDGTLTVLSRFNLGEGHLNRTGLWHGGPQIVRFTPDGERLLFIRDTEMELRLPSRPKALLQAQFPQPIRDAVFSPDYEHLFVLGDDGIVYVCNPGTLTSVRARLRWHLGPVSRLAVSPDGQTLATAGAEGVKLWPVGQLMPLLKS